MVVRPGKTGQDKARILVSRADDVSSTRFVAQSASFSGVARSASQGLYSIKNTRNIRLRQGETGQERARQVAKSVSWVLGRLPLIG